MSTPPTTVVSFVRHAHVSPIPDTERTPSLSHHGRHDAARVTARLADLADVIAASPAERARTTVGGVADATDAPLIVDDDLRERELVNSPIEDSDEAVEHPWASPNASHPSGESHAKARTRGVIIVNRLVEAYPDRHVVVDTHATLMALVFNAYDPRYGREFQTELTTPDVYEVAFVNSEVFSIARTWAPEEAARKGDADHDPVER